MATGGQIDTDILSDETFDVLCSICKNEGKNTEGAMFCLDCRDYFCKGCVKVHNKVPLCAGHKLLDKAMVKSGTSTGLQWAPAERCDKHSHKHIDMYCQNHDTVGCSTCMAIYHRSCKDTFYIPEFLKNNSQHLAAKEIQAKLTKIANNLGEQIRKCIQDKQKLLKMKIKILSDIRKFRQDINKQLDKLEDSSIDEIEEKIRLLDGKIEECQKQLQVNEGRVTSARKKLTSYNLSQAQAFIYVKIGDDTAKIANEFIEATVKKSSEGDIEFLPDTEILTKLNDMKNLGTFKDKTTKAANNLLQTTGQQSYNIKVESDKKDSCITSSCYMKDGSIVLADNSNKKLKRVENGSFSVRDYFPLHGEPLQVCAISDTNVAVSLGCLPEVQFISLIGKMKATHKIHTDFYCHGLAFSNNYLFISDSGTSVYIYTMSGEKVKQIGNDQLGLELFANIYSISVSKDATRILVADGCNGLIVLDTNGQFVTKIDDKQLQMPTHCYLTETGAVLVSGYSSKNVVQITANGELIGEVISAEKVNKPICSVCCNQQMTQIYIYKSFENKIEVFDVQ